MGGIYIFFPDFSTSSHRIPYVFAGKLLILVNQGRVQGPLKVLINQKFSEWSLVRNLLVLINQGRVQAFLPPQGLTKPGRRMPPCEESPGIDKSGNGSGWMGGWEGDILTSSGSDQTGSQNAPL